MFGKSFMKNWSMVNITRTQFDSGYLIHSETIAITMNKNRDKILGCLL